MASSAPTSRWGASKKIMVRGSDARAASAAARSPALRGRKPSKQKRSVGRPETASAASVALGPGRTVTSTPAAIAAVTARKPGSDTVGIPASETTRTVAPPTALSTSPSALSRSL